MTIATELNGRQVLLTPEASFVRSASMKTMLDDHGYMHLSGRFVGAERANSNGALWLTEDLEMGLPTVAHGPLNWLHEERRIIGTITDARLLVEDRESAGVGPHIAADSVVWKWIWPREAAVLQQASDAGMLWYSMECISEEVECGECDTRVSYLETQRALMDRPDSRVCYHIRERSASRRFINPLFQGGGVIIPPVSPGWRDADLRVRERAEQLAVATLEDSGLDAATWESMMAQVVQLHGR